MPAHVISRYSFGRITVDGVDYSADLVIFPDRVEPSWRRRQGHSLEPADLEGVVEADPELLIIGTGHSGVMRVPRITAAFFQERGVRVEILSTGAAVELYNRAGGRVIAALHLTC